MRHRKNQSKSIFKTKAGEIEYYDAYEKALTLWPVRFNESDIPTRFGSTHVITSGDAGSPPVVLLHGAQASSTMWFANIQALAAKYRVYAIDFLLEAGKSIPTKLISTKLELAQWLVEIFDHYRLDHPSVVGISRGAWNGVVLASLFPQRVNRLVLVSPAQVFTAITNLKFLYITVLCAFLPSEKHIRRMVQVAMHKAPQIPELYLRQYECALRNFNILNGISLLPSVFSRTEFQPLTMPCLLMIGDHDVVNTLASIDQARAMIPALEIEIVSDAGHILTMDQPEYVTDRIIRFLCK